MMKMVTMKMNQYRLSVLIALLATINFACQESQPEEIMTAFVLSDLMEEKCEFLEVEAKTVNDRLLLFGKISAANDRLSKVYPVVGGVVTAINVELGDYVEQGNILASIRSGEIAQYEKERIDAQNDVTIAERRLQVAKDLYEGKLNTEKDLAVAKSELEKAKSELSRISEVYNIYNLKNGSTYHVTAPTSGFVISKQVSQNEQIRADSNEPLFSIAETNEVWVLANVHESDILKVSVGQEATIKTLAFPDVVYRGKIDKIFNAIDPVTKSMKVRITIPNTDFKLMPEMNCTVDIIHKEDKKMVAIPSSAVIFDKSRYWVVVYRDKYRLERRSIHPFRQFEDITYVADGLEEGETIITQNGLLVYDALGI